MYCPNRSFKRKKSKVLPQCHLVKKIKKEESLNKVDPVSRTINKKGLKFK